MASLYQILFALQLCSDVFAKYDVILMSDFLQYCSKEIGWKYLY